MTIARELARPTVMARCVTWVAIVCTIFAWVCFVGAVVTVPVRRALAIVIVEQVNAGCVVVARPFSAFVDLGLAVLTLEASYTRTGVRVERLRAVRFVQAWLRCALVYVSLAVVTSKTGHTRTLVPKQMVLTCPTVFAWAHKRTLVDFRACPAAVDRLVSSETVAGMRARARVLAGSVVLITVVFVDRRAGRARVDLLVADCAAPPVSTLAVEVGRPINALTAVQARKRLAFVHILFAVLTLPANGT